MKPVSLVTLANSLNLAVRHNKTFTVVYVNDYLVSLLQLFKKSGFIYDYFVLPEGYYKAFSVCELSPAYASRVCLIYLRYNQEHNPSLHSVKLLSKPSRQLFVTWDSLRKLVRPNQITEVYVLNTVKGLMTHPEALQAQIGGNLIVKVT